MLIQALCEYYEILKRMNKVPANGYSNVNIQYRVSLTPEGKIDGIEEWTVPQIVTDKKGKSKEIRVPRAVEMFRRTEKPGIDANIAEHRPLYLFGLNMEKDGKLNPQDRTDKAVKSHQDYVEKTNAFINGIDSPMVNAYRNFLRTWNPQQETENPFLINLGKQYPKAGYAFCLSGHPDVMLHDDSQLKARWEEKLEAETTEDKVMGQCAVMGQEAEIAVIHDRVSGVLGGLPTGTKLVCFNNDSEYSYGAQQAINSNISTEVMRKYTQALNTLLGSKANRTCLGDMTVVHFAMSENSLYNALASRALLGENARADEEDIDDDDDDETLNAKDTEKLLKKIYAETAAGSLNAARLLIEDDIDPAVNYYIVGLKPNSSRLAMQFIYRNSMGQLIQNAALHQKDMAVYQKAKPVELWQITKQMVSPKASKQVVHSSLSVKLLQSIVFGYPYPAVLLATVVRRVRTDSDEENNKFIKLNPTRAGIIKACLNREARKKIGKEEIQMALDKENTNPAYLCGRLFAVLEKVQEEANPGLNRTITDSYFASASARPAVVFSKLIKLSKTHLKKLTDRQAGYWNWVMGEIIAKLDDAFPDMLSLADQGRFDIGYYQQKYAASEKKKADQPEQLQNEEEE